MKTKLFFLVVPFLLTSSVSVSYASIDTNLKYGQKSQEVSELQEFLVDRDFLKSSPSGFFGLLTLRAVKAYQASVALPPSGFVGPMTRAKINKELDENVATSIQAEIAETGTTTPKAVDVCSNIEGVQTFVPSGMIVGYGVCAMPVSVVSQVEAPVIVKPSVYSLHISDVMAGEVSLNFTPRAVVDGKVVDVQYCYLTAMGEKNYDRGRFFKDVKVDNSGTLKSYVVIFTNSPGFTDPVKNGEAGAVTCVVNGVTVMNN